ncbi:MAG: DUF4906 domain-containing protein [Bacteroidaceae bacterium]|nr:DUF4906 domain-containing protein [Bacteroidaceae bacterium]
MQKRNIYIWGLTLIAAVVALFSSCTADDDFARTDRSYVEVIARVPSFEDYDVFTRGIKNSAESNIKYMALLTFDDAKALIDIQQLQSSTPLFVIDRNDLQQKAAAKGHTVNSASMYLIANVSQGEAADWAINNETDLQNLLFKTSTTSVDIPANGFPMSGSKTGINLNPGVTITDSKIEIELENLYAKVVFNISVDPEQALNTPTFQLTNWEVHNLPKNVKMLGNVRNDGQTYSYNDTIPHYISSRRGAGTTLKGATPLTFSFYMPEHLVNPGQTSDSYTYPDNDLTDTEKQRYKPCLVEKALNGNIPAAYDAAPAYVVLNGIYTDHQKKEHSVSYKLYLGADGHSNFQIVRNGQYNNSVVIRGVTNSSDAAAGTVSLDHRVNIYRRDFVITMERETMLDSHIEVRPVQIRIPQKDGVNQSVKCYLAAPDATATPVSSTDTRYAWVRMEPVVGAMNTNVYCTYDGTTNIKNKGRRKYFTTGLLAELNNRADHGISYTFSDENNSLWLYFDENTNASENGVRNVLLVVEYYENGTKVSANHYTFQQHDLFPVIYQDEETGKYYRYDIEFYEEYLYNYNANDGYDATVEGMPWGPETTISEEILAVQGSLSSFSWAQAALEKAGGKYDFQNNFWGRVYTKKLVNTMTQTVLSQDQMPNSAAQHCHNKNKRKDNGEVESIQWYLPAIGELQHIMSAAYTKFDMFQENRYWSSQTSYRIGHFKYSLLWGILGSVEGDYYYEDHEYARATKAMYEGNNVYTYEPSEVQGISKTWTGSVTNQTGNFSTEVAPSSRDTGNRQRSDINRVRAVRNKYKRAVGSSTWTEIVTEE